MKVKDKKSVQSLLKVDDLKQNKIYLNKKNKWIYTSISDFTMNYNKNCA